MKCCLISILCLLFCFKSRAQGKFRIEGTIPSIHNGKYIYLWGIDYSKMNPAVKDSALIKNGNFRFSGNINTPALLASLYLKNISDFFGQFYIEGGVMKITAIPRNGPGTFATVQVNSSRVNSRYKEWRKKIDSTETELLKLYPLIDSLAQSKADSATMRLMQERQTVLKAILLEKEIEFVRTYPGDYISLYWFAYKMINSLSAQPVMLKKLFASLTPELQNLPEGKALKKAIDVIAGMQPGQKLPQFILPDSSGREYSLNEFKGKYILLDFWASWCKPCVEKIPELKQLYSLYHKKGLDIVGISIDYNRENWLKSMQLHQLPWIQLSQLKGWNSAIVQEFNITYLPQTILVDAQRNIIAIDPVLPAKLKELLP